MAKTTTAGDRRQLRGDLDRLVRRARKVLDKAYLGARSRQVLCRTLALSFLFALPLLLVELVRYVAGYPSFGLHGWQYAALVAGGAGVFALGWLLRDFLRHVLPRRTTLGLFDRQLKLANRLATADEFIGARERTGFMQAAIDDAVEPVQRAMGSNAQAIGADPRWPLSRGALLSALVTVCLLLMTIWLGAQEQGTTGGELFAGTVDDFGASPDLSVVPRLDDETAREEARRSGDELLAEKTPGAEPGETADAAVPDSVDSSAPQPGGQPALLESQSEPSAGQPAGGVPSGAGSRPAGQTAGGQQSTSGREASTGEENRQAGSERQQASGQQQAGSTQSSGQQSANQSGDAADSDSAASGDQSADSGQESAAGNDSSAAPTDSAQSAQNAQQQAANRQSAQQQPGQRAGQPQGSESGQGRERGRTDGEGAGGEQGGGEPDAQGQAQSQGQGGQPNAGQSQSSSSGGEGRGAGDDPIKKNRGAAKAMLAVPKPDRLVGVRGDGPEQIRQEQSVPQEQQAAPVAANARSERGERIGTLQQTEVSGWSRALVKNYFDRGGSATAGVPGDASSTTTDSSEGQQR